jgi:hypothetical protein
MRYLRRLARQHGQNAVARLSLIRRFLSGMWYKAFKFLLCWPYQCVLTSVAAGDSLEQQAAEPSQ